MEIRREACKFFSTALALSLAGGALAAPEARAANWNGRIVDVKTGADVALSDLVARLSARPIVILGEKHDTPEVQSAQASVIAGVVGAVRAQEGSAAPFSTSWEFLNFTDQSAIGAAFARLASGAIGATDFLKQTQGSDSESSYIPILQTTANLGGELHGVNISRADKAPVVQHGISAADPKLVPPGYAKGDANYYERFVAAMSGGHATPDEMSNYFDAQCLTDDVIAYHLLQDSQTPLKFLVEGGFHTDYLDGTVARVHARTAQPVFVVRFMDASDYPASLLPGLLPGILNDPKYGPIADFVFFVKEPTSP